MGFLRAIGRAIAAALRPLVPGLRAPTGGRPRPVLRWIFRILIVSAILVGLWLLNRYLELDRYVRAPLPALREFWLPLLFLLFYTLIWLGWALWRAITSDPEGSDFPDIDLAWDEAVGAMAEAGLDFREAPVFLVLGRPSGGEKALFGAGGVKLLVKQAPRRPDAPLTVSANADGIYITCSGASLLGAYAALAAGAPETTGRALAATSAASVEIEAAAPSGSTALDPEEPDRSGSTALLVAADDPDLDEQAGRSRPSLLRDPEEMERLAARLRHLGHRIARERRPYCPINGVLALIPFASTLNDAEAKEVGTLCQRDLAAIREVMKVECPVFALVCDLERVPGYAEFLAFFPEGQRRRFLGQPFPLVPDLDPTLRSRMVEKGVQWIGDVLFPRLVYRLWTPDGADATVPLGDAANVRLFEFLEAIREAGRRLGRILNRGIVMPAAGPPMLGGCGFAATGRDLVREQGFAASVFRLLVENQNHVAWTADARRADAEYRRWSALAYVGLALATAAMATLGYIFWPRR